MPWTNVEIEVMTALTCQVRILSQQQLARGWPIGYSTGALAVSIATLTATQLLQCRRWTVVTPHIGNAPICTWRPGEPKPDTWRLSKVIRARWNRPATKLIVYQATELAGRLFGSRSGHNIRDIEQRHDLLLAEVFVLYRLRLAELAACWVGEHALPMAERGVKNPDAFLFDKQRQPRRVIESAGSYSQSQVDTFHEYCRVCRLPYELW